jgi:hypothetical protein
MIERLIILLGALLAICLVLAVIGLVLALRLWQQSARKESNGRENN